MSSHELGVDIDDLALPTKAALRKAAELDLRAVEMAPVSGEVAAWNLSHTGRRHLSRFAGSLGLRFASLVADVPGLRLSNPNTADEQVHRAVSVVDMAASIDVPTVTISLGGPMPGDEKESLSDALDALARIGDAAESRGRILAVRPVGVAGDDLADILDNINCPAIKVCLDPAALVMAGCSPLASPERLAERIALVHARDGTAGLGAASGHEVRFGEGDVDFVGLLALLDSADYRAPYILRRRNSQEPVADIASTRDAMKRLFPPA